LPTLPSIDFRHKELVNQTLEIFSRRVSIKTQQILIPEFLDFGTDRILLQRLLHLLEVAKKVDILREVISLIPVVISQHTFGLIQLLEPAPHLLILPLKGPLQELTNLLLLGLQQHFQLPELFLNHLLQKKIRLLQFRLIRLTHHQQPLHLLNHLLGLVLEPHVLLLNDPYRVLDR